MGDDTVLEAIDEGEAELGIGTKRALDVTRDPWLEFEPLYDTAIFLVTAANHPLARRRRIGVADLLRYPLLNAVPEGVPDLVTLGVLQRAGTMGGSSPVVEVQFAATIRRYAALGLGIGLVPAPLTRKAGAGLHERDMSQHFGKMAVYRLSRKDVPLSPQAAAFASLVRERLHKEPARRK
jgi:DNA-binding transcriptional LysR family regulator